MNDEPRPISDSMAEVRRNLIRSAPTGEGDELTDADIIAAREKGRAEMDLLRWQRAVPAKFSTAMLDDLDGAAGASLAEWSVLERPPNLVLMGPWGTGKSYAAAAAVRPAFMAFREVRFLPVAELLDSLRPSEHDRQTMAELMEIDRLIIDDLGAEKKSEWTAERLDMLINRRWLEERPTIVTTNLDGSALEEHVGGHCYSRLVGGALAVEITGADRRRK